MKLKYKKKGGLTAESIRVVKQAIDSGQWLHDKPKLERDVVQKTGLLPLHWELMKSHYRCSAELHKRKKNWLETIPGYSTFTDEITFQYRGKYKGYHGSNYQPVVKSIYRYNRNDLFAVINDTEKDQHIHLHAGRGYHFDVDSNGLRLVKTSTGDDLHLDTSILTTNFISLRAELLANAAKRKEKRVEDKETKRLLKKYGKQWVGFEDSLKAGNCMAGTKSFCHRHGLDPKKHYRVDNLPESSNKLVIIAAAQAARRHVADIKRGYCEIPGGQQ